MKSLLLLSMVLLSTAVHSGVYKWVDKHGKTHYGDRPNSDAVQEIKINSTPATPQTTHGSTDNKQAIDRWLKARDVERQSKKKKEAELEKEKAIARKECVKLKRELADLERGGVTWYDLDETGKRRYYSDKEIASDIVKLKETVKQNCDG